MKIIVDGFGGDNAPLATLEGAALAVSEYSVEIIMTGDEAKLREVAEKNNISLKSIEIVNASQVIPVEADSSKILSDYKDSSMAVAFRLLVQGKGEAVVCAGSTGAIVVGASLVVKRLKGIKRAALAPILPSDKGPFILLDVGANVECRPEMLVQFAIMGSAYMNKIMKCEKPRVGLVNIGAEDTKGRELETASYKLLSECKNINFTGNIEPRYIPAGDADVVVTDGFTGNVVLKLTEGYGKTISNTLKNIFSGTKGKLSAMMVMSKVKEFKGKMDYTEYGGAPLLGISKPVIKAHGSSNAKAFKNAIRQARDFVQNGVNDEIAEVLASIKE